MTTTANDVIESYVRDVARLLPHRRRGDVARELRVLLHEELAAKADAAGRAPDRAMALSLLAAFGEPAEAATRYEPRRPLIDPRDNHDFAIWMLVGLAVIGMSDDRGELSAITWLGTLALAFMAIAWFRRRRPEGSFRWKPRPQPKPARAPRWQALLAAAGLTVFPLAMYVAPQAFWDTATLGHGVGGGLALTDGFLHSWQRAATIGWLVAYVAVWLAVAAQGGWRRWSRRAGIVTAVGLGMLLLAHAAPMASFVDGTPFAIFVLPGADAVAAPWFRFAGALLLLGALYDGYLEWVRVEPETAGDARAGATASA
jgi:multisubunit Na+/H+ antiporter MnhB subunit